MIEISRSRIIRITNYSARTYTYTYMCAQVRVHNSTHTHVYIGVKEMAAAAICIESDDDVVEPEVESKKTQSSIESFFAPLPAGQVPSPRPRSKVQLCIHESREQRSLTRTR